MGTFYRNRETGIIQSHPQSGIGDSLNSDEIGEDGKPVKPFVKLPITPDKVKRASALAKGDKTTEANPGIGDSTQEGDI